MGWLGKIVGGTIGFAMGGPFGALAGTVFGHAYDKSSENEHRHSVLRLSAEEKTQVTFFVAVFSMLAELVKVDGHISREEIDSIEHIMVYDLNLNAASRQIGVNIFNTALESPESFQDYANQFYSHFYSNPHLLEFLLDILFKVSNADGRLSRSEEELIRSAAAIFQFSNQRFENIRSRYVPRTDRYYSILGCSPSDTDGQIKSSYRKLVREFHPDTVTAKGLPEEFTAFAHEKFREVQRAYEAVKKERGIK